jgi:hypothetical protein
MACAAPVSPVRAAARRLKTRERLGVINSAAGRLARVAAGVMLIVAGYSSGAVTSGIVLMAVGLLPLATGALNLCVISALLGGPIRGVLVGNR